MTDKNKTIANVERFLELLPKEIKTPVRCAEPDNKILLEWYKRDNDYNITIYSIIFDGKEMIFSLYDGRRTKTMEALVFAMRILKN